MAIFFLFFTVSFGARSILAERRQGTLRRLLATAAPPGGVLAGKALAAFTLGTASVLVMWLATTLVFTLALLGGNFVYLAQLPELLQRLALLPPTAGPCAASSTWSPTAAAWPRWPGRWP